MRKKPRQNEMSPIYLTVSALGKYKYTTKIKNSSMRKLLKKKIEWIIKPVVVQKKKII